MDVNLLSSDLQFLPHREYPLDGPGQEGLGQNYVLELQMLADEAHGARVSFDCFVSPGQLFVSRTTHICSLMEILIQNEVGIRSATE